MSTLDSQQNDRECTFKPNLSKTSKSNSNVLSKHWLPIKKGNFSVTRQPPFSAKSQRKRALSTEQVKSARQHEIFLVGKVYNRKSSYAEKYGYRR